MEQPKVKFRISIIDFMLENGKHEVSKDVDGDPLCLGDMVEYQGDKSWFAAYRYGLVLLKQVGMMAMIGTDLTKLKKQNIFGAGSDWLIIGYTDEPFFEKVKHLV
jgi:hypothetical protein